MVLNNIGNIYFSIDKYEQALEKYKDALRRRKQAEDSDPNDPDTANTLNNIAGFSSFFFYISNKFNLIMLLYQNNSSLW